MSYIVSIINVTVRTQVRLMPVVMLIYFTVSEAVGF